MKRTEKQDVSKMNPSTGEKINEGYPLYPEEEDIYKKCKKNRWIDPEDISHIIKPERPGKMNEKSFDEDMTGEDLDVPGSEDDSNEQISDIEDEENSYFSLGGDDHENLEENTDFQSNR